MMKLVVKIATLAFVASQVFAAVEKKVEDKKDSKTDATVVGGAVNHVADRQTYVKSLVSSLNSKGLLGKTNSKNLESQLTKSDVVVTSEKKATKDSAVETVEFKLMDILRDLSTRTDITGKKLELTQTLIEALSNERGGAKDKTLSKMLSEANVMLEAGSKATDADIDSFVTTLSAMNDMVAKGEAKNMDEAAKKTLTKEARENLDGCYRG
jgi:hypothetical protein